MSLHGCCQRFFGVDYVASDQKTVWFSCSGSTCNSTRCLVQHQPSWWAQSFCWNSEIGTFEANRYSSDGVQATCSCDSGCFSFCALCSISGISPCHGHTYTDSLSLSLTCVWSLITARFGRFYSLPSHKRAFILHRRASYWCSFLNFLDAYRRLRVSRLPFSTLSGTLCLGPWKVGKTIWRIWQIHWTIYCVFFPLKWHSLRHMGLGQLPSGILCWKMLSLVLLFSLPYTWALFHL